jgi:nicotinate-nucleotide--dimethylbenzimidazole phosphoribosyltransferase
MNTTNVRLGKKAVVAMCADNGVVEEGVTQTGQEVTAIVAENMTRHDTSVCHMATVAHADVFPVDVGVYRPIENAGILQKCVRRGTRNMAKEPAMTREEALQAIQVGIDVVCQLKERGYGLIATGEMGIGNTTTSSAIVSVLLDKDPSEVTGRGAGLSSEGLNRKVGAIETAIAKHQPDPKDPLDVLAKVGGLDIAGLVGVYLGCAANRIPVLVDGFISAAAALVAVRMCPAVNDYLMASHVSKEPAGQMMMDALHLTPILHGEMCLGEGTGAVAVMPLLEMGLAVYHGMVSFEDTNIETYVPQE